MKIGEIVEILIFGLQKRGFRRNMQSSGQAAENGGGEGL